MRTYSPNYCIDFNPILLNNTDQQVSHTRRGWRTGAKSANYICLALCILHYPAPYPCWLDCAAALASTCPRHQRALTAQLMPADDGQKVGVFSTRRPSLKSMYRMGRVWVGGGGVASGRAVGVNASLQCGWVTEQSNSLTKSRDSWRTVRQRRSLDVLLQHSAGIRIDTQINIHWFIYSLQSSCLTARNGSFWR